MFVIQTAELNWICNNTDVVTLHFICFSRKKIIILRTTDIRKLPLQCFHLNSDFCWDVLYLLLSNIRNTAKLSEPFLSIMELVWWRSEKRNHQHKVTMDTDCLHHEKMRKKGVTVMKPEEANVHPSNVIIISLFYCKWKNLEVIGKVNSTEIKPYSSLSIKTRPKLSVLGDREEKETNTY